MRQGGLTLVAQTPLSGRCRGARVIPNQALLVTATDAAVQLLLLLLLLFQLLHCGCCTATNWDTTDDLAATQRPVSFGTVSDGRGRGQYRASLVVDAAAASAATATATTTVLRKQLRKLQSNKSGGRLDCGVSTRTSPAHSEW